MIRSIGNKTKQMRESVNIHFGFNQWMSQEGFDLRGEKQRATSLGIEKRFDPQVIACEKQLLLALIPDTKGEDTVQMAGASLTPLNIRMQQNLGIRIGREGMTSGLQLCTQFAEIIQLTVIGDGIALL